MFVVMTRDIMRSLANHTQNSIDFTINKALVTYLGVLYSNIYINKIFLFSKLSMKTGRSLFTFRFVVYVEG